MDYRRPRKPTKGKQVLSRNEAAWVASVSVHLLDQLACRGGGPKFVRPAGVRDSRYQLADVVQWAQARAARRAGAVPGKGGDE